MLPGSFRGLYVPRKVQTVQKIEQYLRAIEYPNLLFPDAAQFLQISDSTGERSHLLLVLRHWSQANGHHTKSGVYSVKNMASLPLLLLFLVAA
jgi:hypothetical protein